MPQIQITIVTTEVGQLFDDILDQILNDLTIEPISHGTRPLKQLIPHHYYPNYNVYQGQCYKQYSSNLCGYHATFNALCCLHMYLNLKSEYLIDNGSSFWKFKKKVEKFLLEIKQANKLEDKWPWRPNDILWGDFERTYNKICIQLFDDFDIFRENHQQFTYMNFTWEFQYQNLLLSQQTKSQLNKKIQLFKEYQGQKPLIFGIMLGITCHWTVLMAFKRNGKAQFWYFDSHNDYLLDYNQQQIAKYLHDYENERLVMKKSKLTNFQKQKYCQSIKDSQISIKLIVDCLEDRATIDKYVYNQLFNVFARPLESAVKIGDKAIFSQSIKDYWINISGFFNKPVLGRSTLNWDLLSEESKKRMKLLFQAAEWIKPFSSEGRSFCQLLNKH